MAKQGGLTRDVLQGWLNLIESAVVTTKHLENLFEAEDPARKNPASGYYEAHDSNRKLVELAAMLNARLEK